MNRIVFLARRTSFMTALIWRPGPRACRIPSDMNSSTWTVTSRPWPTSWRPTGASPAAADPAQRRRGARLPPAAKAVPIRPPRWWRHMQACRCRLVFHHFADMDDLSQLRGGAATATAVVRACPACRPASRWRRGSSARWRTGLPSSRRSRRCGVLWPAGSLVARHRPSHRCRGRPAAREPPDHVGARTREFAPAVPWRVPRRARRLVVVGGLGAAAEPFGPRRATRRAPG